MLRVSCPIRPVLYSATRRCGIGAGAGAANNVRAFDITAQYLALIQAVLPGLSH